MPDRRTHRGPHPQDQHLFGDRFEPVLRRATSDLSWLLTRRYAPTSALKLVGDRYRLNARQRTAVSRCAAADQDVQRRQQHRVDPNDLSQQQLWIDGYNVLTSIEAALSGGVILCGRDGCYRDMASMHGSYRRVQETLPAIHLIGQFLTELNVTHCHWLFDAPVSNSGRLKNILVEKAQRLNWPWSAELAPNPDATLIATDQLIASADSQILDHARRWFNLARSVIQMRLPQAWVIDLSV